MSRVTVVTGAARGIGRELVGQALAAGDRVLASVRTPTTAFDALPPAVRERLTVLTADLGAEGAPAFLAAAIAAVTDRVDLLINNAGIYSTLSPAWDPGRTHLGAVDADEMLTVYRVNTVAPLLLVQALRPLLTRSGRAVVLNVSSLLGSVSARTGPGDYAYSASKAALNSVTRGLAAELRDDGITCLAITPGWVRTDMGGPEATLDAATSARGMLEVADRATLRDSGRFVDHAGEDQPW